MIVGNALHVLAGGASVLATLGVGGLTAVAEHVTLVAILGLSVPHIWLCTRCVPCI